MAKRINKIQEFLDEKDIDALLIKSKTVKKWMSTMTGSGCQVLITKEHGYLIVDGRYITEAKEKEHDLEIILHNPHLTGRNYLGTVEEILKKENCKTLGVEAYQVLVKEYQEIEKLGIEVLLLDQEIAHLRIIKEDEEIEAMKKSIAITDEIYQKVIEHIHVGMSEYEISALVQYYSIASGAQQMSFDTIVATGERTALPHGRPTSRKVKAHEPIMIDFGIQYQNYQSDMTRMCFIGEPDPKIKEIYDLLEFYAEKNDQERFTEVNIDFHEAIYRATHSQYFEQLLSDINYYIHVTSRHSIKQPNRLIEAAKEHKEIYEAIVKKDKALAKANVEKHIRKTQSLVRNYYDEKDETQE